MSWYNKYNTTDKSGSLSCPNCNHTFEERIMYFYDIESCPNCQKEIGILAAKPYYNNIYTINLTDSPKIFHELFELLETRNQKEAFNDSGRFN